MDFSLRSLRVEQPVSAFAEGNVRWTNRDLDPVPKHDRKWGAFSFVAYWISDAFTPTTCQIASSIIATGLSWRDALSIIAVGYFILAIVIALNGATGVLYHAPFPVLARASWGFWGSYVAIVLRVILAVFWFAIQTMNGAECLRIMIGAIWPSFLRLHNEIPEEQGITTNQMVSFLIFWLLQLPFLMMHPNMVRWLFITKSVLVPITFLALLIWSFTGTKTSFLSHSPPTQLSGSSYAWAYLSSMTSTIGGYTTLSVNQADFSRYSRVSVRWQLMYVPLLPIIFTIVSFVGIAASTAGQAKYGGELQWDPIALISKWGNRAARFFAAAGFALSVVGLNVSANSLSAANDLMALAPRYVNIRRGQLICAVVCWALVPWKILASAKSLLNFLSAYAVFFGPIAGILLVDFWILKERKYDIRDLYSYRGSYHYWHGINWRAWVSFVVASTPTLPGLAQTVSPGTVDVGVWVHPFQFGWFLSLLVGSGLYLTLSYAIPARGTFVERAVRPDEVYEEMGREKEVLVDSFGEDAPRVEGTEVGHNKEDEVTEVTNEENTSKVPEEHIPRMV